MTMMGVVGLESTRTKATWNFTLRVLGQFEYPILWSCFADG